jgi:hypothetical protein
MMMSRPSALIVTYGDDVHGLVVARRVAEITCGAVQSLLLDVATIPTTTIDWSIDAEPNILLSVARAAPFGIPVDIDLQECCPIEAHVALRDVVGVWWRRPRPVGQHKGLAPVPELADASRRGFSALFRSFAAVAPTFNDPDAQRRANLKPVQLHLAQRCGFSVPRTLITSTHERARDFIEAVHARGVRVIYKPVESASDGPPVRLFRDEDYSRLQSGACQQE